MQIQFPTHTDRLRAQAYAIPPARVPSMEAEVRRALGPTAQDRERLTMTHMHLGRRGAIVRSSNRSDGPVLGLLGGPRRPEGGMTGHASCGDLIPDFGRSPARSGFRLLEATPLALALSLRQPPQ